MENFTADIYIYIIIMYTYVYIYIHTYTYTYLYIYIYTYDTVLSWSSGYDGVPLNIWPWPRPCSARRKISAAPSEAQCPGVTWCPRSGNPYSGYGLGIIYTYIYIYINSNSNTNNDNTKKNILKDRITPSQILPKSRNKSSSGTGKERKTKEVVEQQPVKTMYVKRCV